MTFGNGYHNIISNKDMIEFHVDYGVNINKKQQQTTTLTTVTDRSRRQQAFGLRLGRDH
jgi:hypothetical protein